MGIGNTSGSNGLSFSSGLYSSTVRAFTRRIEGCLRNKCLWMSNEKYYFCYGVAENKLGLPCRWWKGQGGWYKTLRLDVGGCNCVRNEVRVDQLLPRAHWNDTPTCTSNCRSCKSITIFGVTLGNDWLNDACTWFAERLIRLPMTECARAAFRAKTSCSRNFRDSKDRDSNVQMTERFETIANR